LRLGAELRAGSGAAKAVSSRGQRARRRAGFTLVEVIVVLVILAILAAIAIPALTGYIDKANNTEMELRLKTAKTAFQTMLAEQYANDGGIETYASTQTPVGSYFKSISSYGGGIGFMITGFTTLGIEEYEALTSDTQSVTLDGKYYLRAYTDLAGSIKIFLYSRTEYFGTNESNGDGGALAYYWIGDVTDPVSAYFITSYETYYAGAGSTFTNGLNAYRENHVARTWEKIL
jgi:prepilin-type N-terminal cleavage/methylation domain-containing protein